MSKLKTIDLLNQNLGKRRRAEKRFRFYGLISIFFGLLCLAVLLFDIGSKSLDGFFMNYVRINVTLDQDELGLYDAKDDQQLRSANYAAVIQKGLREALDSRDRKLMSLISELGSQDVLLGFLRENPDALGGQHTFWIPLDDDIEYYLKSLDDKEPFTARVTEKQIAWLNQLKEAGHIENRFNWLLFTNSDSNEPEIAGILAALVGSFYTLLVTFLLSFTIGIAAAIYLEEYAPKNRLTDFIEVNINNLAAVPSIIFGLLGSAVFLAYFGMPRSAPIVGGLVLTLMTMPTIIISSRAAIKAVPPSIRQAAYGIGASKMQVTLHHVLPLAMPGMLTGAIVGMAQALGETAPLLLIGMVAFIQEVPDGLLDQSSALPVQIFMWSDQDERLFESRASAAIVVLLAFLILMNIVAVWARRRLERRW